jgi:hypothetical protein
VTTTNLTGARHAAVTTAKSTVRAQIRCTGSGWHVVCFFFFFFLKAKKRFMSLTAHLGAHLAEAIHALPGVIPDQDLVPLNSGIRPSRICPGT